MNSRILRRFGVLLAYFIGLLLRNYRAINYHLFNLAKFCSTSLDVKLSWELHFGQEPFLAIRVCLE